METEKVFVEYAIAEEALDAYRAFMAEKRSGGMRFEWYEGTDQPGLFVEVWPGVAYAAYEEFKHRRSDPEDPDWGKLGDWVRGGLGKVHVWHFSAVLK
ncbi:hypothetical protein SD70_00355 [Gordoniibacillus kamchatkensis]|uniref:NIPSNAP domain-containing protein n=1 Tax=Gordoniibacillus kamchatkensis TaxID=1590651 RepID=A0ABR5AN18_9BACL|nr:hypothetical protein [Paenibacillus sp. VKM B-2647]KIL42416.1 hypothetical protein SD70_00355 [Paenibacillus sp. VKM B-2647]